MRPLCSSSVVALLYFFVGEINFSLVFPFSKTTFPPLSEFYRFRRRFAFANFTRDRGYFFPLVQYVERSLQTVTFILIETDQRIDVDTIRIHPAYSCNKFVFFFFFLHDQVICNRAYTGTMLARCDANYFATIIIIETGKSGRSSSRNTDSRQRRF